ncbi:nitroreductase family protein [Chloroflexota bacterium]
MDYASLLEMVKNRRSGRRFKPDPVPQEYIDKIIEVARWAPSGYNMQPWEFVVVNDTTLRDKIAALVKEYRDTHFARMEATRESWQMPRWRQFGTTMDFSTAPVYIIVYGDTRTQAGLPMSVRFTPHKKQSIFNSSLANTYLYMHLAAATLGLAAQWLTLIQQPLVNCMVKNLLVIPEFLEPYDMIVLGYPAGEPKAKQVRERQEMVHYNNCGPETFRTDEQVREFIKRTRAMVISDTSKEVK